MFIINWFKVTFLHYCPNCMVKEGYIGSLDVGGLYEERACINSECKQGKYNLETM